MAYITHESSVGAISILIRYLIRYWSMEYKLEEYFFRDIGLYALGLDISFADTKDAAAAQETPLNSGEEGEMFVGLPGKRAADPTTLGRDSKRRSITAGKDPALVEFAEELLKSLEDAHFNAEPPVCDDFEPLKLPFIRHCEAVWEFWRNQHFRDLMLNHLHKDPHLLVPVKMYSDQFRGELTLDQLKHITTSSMKMMRTN